jgi:broad specificity phosphatase PhoE
VAADCCKTALNECLVGGRDVGSHCEVWLLRHGHSQANDAGLIVSRPDVAKGCYGLTGDGRLEVRDSLTLAREQGLLRGVTSLYTSPFLRATQTSAIAVEVLGLAGFSVEDRLRERWFGQMEMTADANYDRVWAEDAKDPDHTRWGVEAVTAVLKRAGSLICEAVRAPVRGGTVLLVTHGDVASILLCSAAGRDLRCHHLAYGLRTAEIRRLGCLQGGPPAQPIT